ncbi:glycosyltransferase family 39 protein [Streptomyces phaeoluteigriseus]|uniref:Glycosyltransferase family 39 protein n=1 Tax=Streptomyces phaeoluteigriseus TaxID=114686 RepID=A0ABY4Z4C7_9ACTN|nr:glycosyltransferase family 39 protein [Streptomyces phaeoluteigriseus]USQ83202.1 glycosyltransferase family 39 protein [Streptomyces phaeoluteigriseus]
MLQRDYIWVAPVLFAGILARLLGIGNYPFPNDDEGTYLAQAWAVQHGELAHYTYWYDHPPAGWMQLASMSWLPNWLLPDLPTFVQGRFAMLPVAAASMVLVFVIGRRLGLARPTAAAAMLLYALSPLAVVLHRQIYLDNFAVLWVLVSMAFALSPRRHLWHHAAAGMAFALAVLSKETIAVLLPVLLVSLWQGSHPSTRKFSFAGFGSGFILTGLFYPLYALLKGELFPGAGHVSLLGTLKFQLGGREGSGSAFADGTDAHQLFTDWLDRDPYLLIGGAAAAVCAFAVRRLRPVAFAVLVLALVALRPGGYLPQMYIVQVLPFLALTVAGLAQALVTRLPGRPHLRTTASLAAVALAAVFAAPHWYEQDRVAMRADDNGVYADAARWLRETPVGDRDQVRIVTDGVLWLDAVDAGYRPGTGVIWHYKLDQDPAVTKTLPHGWRDIDYVVSTAALRGEREHLPTLRDLFAHSTPVATFGEGGGRIDILRIEHDE